ncbi:MAG: hypothetical protein A2Y17_04875 [Clostridiales bacterium GWF2_38_85]|nr:MAG: hypothetical protein A2Y17_04875 [Clostridiales bacterium GWF2_38_85]HBL84379.1 hypothetical protein [Clostridiales bacterium]
MLSQIGLRKDFDNVSQRIMYHYIVTQPKFVPIKSDIADEFSQKQMYDFLLDLYILIYNDPGFIGMNIEADETEDRPAKYREPFHEKTYVEVRNFRRKNVKKFEDLIDKLLLLGEIGEAQCGKLVVAKEPLGYSTIKFNSLIKALSIIGLQTEVTDDMLLISSNKYPELSR